MRWGRLLAAAVLPLLLTTTHPERALGTMPTGGARLLSRGTTVPRLSAVEQVMSGGCIKASAIAPDSVPRHSPVGSERADKAQANGIPAPTCFALFGNEPQQEHPGLPLVREDRAGRGAGAAVMPQNDGPCRAPDVRAWRTWALRSAVFGALTACKLLCAVFMPCA